MDRRAFLGSVAMVGGMLATRAWALGETDALYAWEYPLEAGILKRLLPDGMSAADAARARIEARVGGDSVIVSVAIRVTAGAKEAWWELASYTNSERVRWDLREHAGRPTKDAEISFLEEDTAVEVELRRRGKSLAVLTGATSGETVAVEASPVVAVSGRLNVDWGFGPLDPGGARLEQWELAGHQATALTAAVVAFPEATFLDPLAELALAGDVSGWTATDVAAPTAISSESAQGGALTRYDRANPLGLHPEAESWPEERSGWVWTPADRAEYRERKEYRASNVDLVDIRVMIDKERFFSFLPLQTIHPRLQPMLRIVGMRVGESEWTPEPYQEVWLLSYAFTGQAAGWYALAHHVSAGGELIHGRETWGYPTKLGEPDVFLSLADYGISVTRNGREALYTAGKVRGFTPGMSLAQFEVFGLRAESFDQDGPTPGAFVHQTWFYQGKRMTADPKSFEIEVFPPGEGEAHLDPWHELGTVRVVGASVMEKGTLQRMPGRIVAPCPDVCEYYRERCDGRLPGEPEGRTPTFVVNSAPIAGS